MGQRITAHEQELERIVERCRIGLTVVDERPDFVQVRAQHRTRDRLLPRSDPVDVTAERVDLAVVTHQPERVRQVPRWKRVGRKALVHHRQRGDHRRVAQIAVVLADLMREEHALIDDRARRHRRHVELLAMAQLQRLDRVPGALADDVELALQRVLVELVGAARDENLPDHRLDFLGPLGETRVVGRHVAPAKEDLAFGGDCPLDLLHAGHAGGRLLGKKDHPRTVLADGGQRQPLAAAHPPQKRIRELNEDAGAVSLERVRTGRAAVSQVLQDLQRLTDDLVALLPLDVGDEPQPAGVVLITRVVEALFARWVGPGIHRRHFLVIAAVWPRSDRHSLKSLTQIAGANQLAKEPSHVIHNVASRQPRRPQSTNGRLRPPKALAPVPNLRFNLKKMPYMLVAAFKSNNRG